MQYTKPYFCQICAFFKVKIVRFVRNAIRHHFTTFIQSSAEFAFVKLSILVSFPYVLFLFFVFFKKFLFATNKTQTLIPIEPSLFSVYCVSVCDIMSMHIILPCRLRCESDLKKRKTYTHTHTHSILDQ